MYIYIDIDISLYILWNRLMYPLGGENHHLGTTDLDLYHCTHWCLSKEAPCRA